MAGKSNRTGITLKEAMVYLTDNAKAEAWFESQRWPTGPVCPHCGGDNILECKNRKPQPYQCRSCKRNFSVKVGTVMQSSNVKYGDWWFAFYLHATNLKGVSSMKLHRDLGVTQKTAWRLLHRIREAWAAAQPQELELTPQQQVILKKDYKDMTMEESERFIALCGSYLLDGELPPALSGPDA